MGALLLAQAAYGRCRPWLPVCAVSPRPPRSRVRTDVALASSLPLCTCVSPPDGAGARHMCTQFLFGTVTWLARMTTAPHDKHKARYTPRVPAVPFVGAVGSRVGRVRSRRCPRCSERGPRPPPSARRGRARSGDRCLTSLIDLTSIVTLTRVSPSDRLRLRYSCRVFERRTVVFLEIEHSDNFRIP